MEATPLVSDTITAVDAKARYSEVSSALRHYSSCVFNLRLATIAQGLILLGGAAALLRSSAYLLATIVAVFGLFFSMVLWALQRSYWIAFEGLLPVGLELERLGAASEAL